MTGRVILVFRRSVFTFYPEGRCPCVCRHFCTTGSTKSCSPSFLLSVSPSLDLGRSTSGLGLCLCSSTSYLLCVCLSVSVPLLSVSVPLLSMFTRLSITAPSVSVCLCLLSLHFYAFHTLFLWSLCLCISAVQSMCPRVCVSFCLPGCFLSRPLPLSERLFLLSRCL